MREDINGLKATVDAIARDQASHPRDATLVWRAQREAGVLEGVRA